MLLGKNVPLITYETPQLNLSFGFNEFFPIIGPLGADLAGEIGAQAQFGFGFDTTGFQQYAADDFRDPSLILDGFYVSDPQNPDGTGPVVPQVELYGSIAAYAALDLGILSGRGRRRPLRLDQFHRERSQRHRPGPPAGPGGRRAEGDHLRRLGRLQAFLALTSTIDLGIFSHTWTSTSPQ